MRSVIVASTEGLCAKVVDRIIRGISKVYANLVRESVAFLIQMILTFGCVALDVLYA
jgi:hypothetical protein